MNGHQTRVVPTSIGLLIFLILLLPLVVMLLFPGVGWAAVGVWLWMLLLIALWAMWMIFAGRRAAVVAPPQPRVMLPDEQPEPIRRVMDVRLALEQDGVQVYRGPLREPASQAFEELKRGFEPRAVPLIQQDEQLGAAIVVMPKPVEQARLEKRSRPWLNLLLFLATVVTTTIAGAAHQGVNLFENPGAFTTGLPYSIGLLAILGFHELGHYFAARYHGQDVTLPYFIPVPFGLGTFGAFIQMRSPPENRRGLFDVAVAGPLAGLVVAIPALIIGLRSSHVVPPEIAQDPMGLQGTSVGSSMLLAIIAKIALGDTLNYGHVYQLSPLAFAGWLGLFITALNLLPIGQLDGGHISRAMFGHRVGTMISNIAMWSLVLLAIFVWPGLMMWAIIIFFLAGRGTPPLNDVTDIAPGRKALGYFSFLILLLIVGSSRVDLQACKLEYSIVSPK